MFLNVRNKLTMLTSWRDN